MTLAVAVAEAVEVDVWVGAGVFEAVGEAVAEAVEVEVLVGDMVDVRVGKAVRDAVKVAVAEAVEVEVLVAVAVSDGEDVWDALAVAVADWDGVRVAVLVDVAVSDGTEVGVRVAMTVAVGVSEGSGVAEDDGVGVEADVVARRFTANWVAVWSIGGTIESVLAPSTGDAATLVETGGAGALATELMVASVTLDPSTATGAIGDAVVSMVPAGDADGLATCGNPAASADAEVGKGEDVPFVEGLSPGVLAALGDDSATNVAKSASTTGDAAETGLACLVSTRSTASSVSTLGATVMTSSFGCDDERVKIRARKRLASRAPTATITFVRFNRGPHNSRTASNRR